MKKLLTVCIVLICTIWFSAEAYAQSDSGTTPAIGTTHTYWVNSTDNGASHTSGVGNDYLWYITKSDLTTKNTSDFTISSTPTYVDNATAVEDLYKLDIIWKASSATSTYYLHVIETGTNGCSNHKVEIISPFSNFQLAVANVDEAALGTEVSQDFANCAPAVTPVLVSNAIKYNYGKTALYYKVDASNLDASVDYVLGYNIALTDCPSTVTASYGTVSSNTYSQTGTLTADGTNQTVTISNSATSSTIYIKIELDNNQGDETTYASPFEGLSSHSVEVTMVSGAQGVAAATLGTSERNQSVSARPSTSGIGSN